MIWTEVLGDVKNYDAACQKRAGCADFDALTDGNIPITSTFTPYSIFTNDGLDLDMS